MPTNEGGPKGPGASPQATTPTTSGPLQANVAPTVAGTTAGTASGQAAQTGDQSEGPGGRQVADVFTKAPATSYPLGVPMAAPARSAFDELRDRQPDHPLVSATPAGEEPRGDQALPAVMTPSGSLPVSQIPGSHAEALTRIVTSPTATPQDVGRTYARRHKVPEEHLQTMGRAEIRAAATDRGYDIGDTGGRGVLVKRFLAEQENDEGLVDRDEELANLTSAEHASTADTAPTETTGAGPGGTTKDASAPSDEGEEG